ncbi:MAG: DUF2442 domain-containing protein [Candidatus Cloacimonadota bacterium]|nr:DUF2442 domain-containing protein [Candidatus Cloacimonadota bacterium]
MFIFVEEAKYLEDYKVELKFNDGKKGIADLESELYGTMFEPLKDKSIFSKVKVDEDLETITWENGADLAPEFLYYKTFQNDTSLESQFKQWGYV